MRIARLATHSLRMMSRYKVRTSFIVLGSLIGIAAITFVVSVGQAAQRKILETVDRMVGRSGIWIDVSGEETVGPRAPATRLKIEDIEALANQVPGIEVWDPTQKIKATIRYGDVTDTANIFGASERWQQVWNRTAVQGDSFDKSAVSGAARVAIIGQTVAQQLFRHDDPIGAEVQIGSVPFKVIGILEAWGTDPHGMDRDNEIIVPISTLMRRLANVDTISGAKLIMSNPERADQIGDQMNRILRERHHLAAGEPSDFVIVTPGLTRLWTKQLRRVFFLYLPSVAACVLLVGGIVSASLMLASVNSRIAEIGLRRAVGARPADLRLQFLLETVLTILAGGVGGIAVGYAAALSWAARMHLGSLSIGMAALIAFGAMSLVGLLAGILPALRAARLGPAEALR